jgi:propionyl-CoA carboxylase alpha chain
LRHAGFLAGDTDTGFLERHGLKALAAPLTLPEGVRRHAVAAALAAQARRRASAPVQPTIPSGFRNNPSSQQEVEYHSGDEVIRVGYRFDPSGHTLAEVTVDGGPTEIDSARIEPDLVALTIDGVTRRYRTDQVGRTAYVDGPDGSSALVEQERFPLVADSLAAGSALAPMPGGVVRVAVAAGDTVVAGQLLVVLEAMKMEHTVHAASAGAVTEVNVAEGDQVETGRVMVVIDSEAADPDEGGSDEGGSDEGRSDQGRSDHDGAETP